MFTRSRRDGRPSIPEFFEGKVVFITGATGFLGKVLVEKLLRSCPGLEKIYIVMRPKKGKNLEERLAEIIALPMFVKIKRQDPSILNKIIPLKGDVYEKNLGLSEEDQRTLIREVGVVFHVAACIRFDDPLKQALLMNTRGTYEVLRLCEQMKNLESFMHVSTAYSCTHKPVIEEKIYPPPGDWRTLVKLAENMDLHTLDIYASKILGEYPNTYTFTKALAEHVVKEFQDTVPAVIFRPSIVSSSIVEPVPGWIDNFNGPIGLFTASGKGIMKIVFSNPKTSPDYVPVDTTVKAMIVAAWNRAVSRDNEPVLPVYNCSTYVLPGVPQVVTTELALYMVKEVPLNDIIWFPNCYVTIHFPVYFVCMVLFHLIPAVLMDFGLKLAKKKPMLLKLQRKIYVANMALTYFVDKQWNFSRDRLDALHGKILKDDTNAFSYNVEDINYYEYFKNCSLGVRQYLLKEDNTEIPEARKHQDKMYWLDKGAKLAALFTLAYFVARIQLIKTVRVYLFKLLNLLIKSLMSL